MYRQLLQTAIHHPTSWVFFGVTAAGLVMALTRADPPLNGQEVAILLALSFIYLFVGTVVFNAVLGPHKPVYKIAYLTFQIALGTLILYLSRGNGWLLMLPLASHSVALFSPGLAVIPCVIITLSVAWNTSLLIPSWLPFLQSMAVFGSAILFAAVFTEISIRDSRRREEIELLNRQLEEANRRLQEYSLQVEEFSASQERTRLARDIHDGLGHYLTAMAVQARVVASLLEQDPGRAGEALTRVQEMIQEALAELRKAVATLRSEQALEKGLPDALEPLLEESRAAGLVAGLKIYGKPYALTPIQELTLYRAVQEGLTNACKHANARRVDVQLEYCPQEVILQVQDDGAGCELSAKDLDSLKRSFGLFGLRERAQLLHGSLAIETAPGKGFRLEVRLPVTGEAG
jgi:signal transduction histidine kinase